MDKKILNVGCGTDTYGTHFVDLYPDKGRNDIAKCNFDSEKIPFSDNYFDVVFSNNVFEHIKNLGFFMGEMVRVLKKGGKIVLVTDNASYYLYHLWKPYSAHYYNYKKHGPEDKHFALFTTTHMENFLKDFHLKPIEISFLTWYDPKKENPVQKYPGWNSKLAIPNRIVGNLPVISYMAFPRILVIAKK
jgi:SAM-dependent methyltransferase